MKKIYTDNEALLEMLADEITINCNEEMEMVISDEDAERIPAIVEEKAPAAINDYCIED